VVDVAGILQVAAGKASSNNPHLPFLVLEWVVGWVAPLFLRLLTFMIFRLSNFELTLYTDVT